MRDMFKPDPASTSFRKPTAEMNVASGCPRFVHHSVIQKAPYLVDDSIFLRVDVESTDMPVP